MRRSVVVWIVLSVAAWTALGVQQVSAQGSVESDRAALVALYDATDGDNWYDNTNWKSERPLGEWYGIRTDSEGRVEWLALGGNNLIGSIPSEIGNFSKF